MQSWVESVRVTSISISEGWEGLTVNGAFPLLEWLGGSARRGVFLTIRKGAETACIKLIMAAGSEADAYLSQWQVAKAMSHPDLARVLESGRCTIDGNEMVFVVTERAEAVLSGIVPRKALDQEKVRKFLDPVLNALQDLHEKGLVHGHLKPSNILLAGDQWKLSGDGLVVAGERPKVEREPGIYDAPETAEGKFSPAADVWSLGMIVAEAFTQHVPASEGPWTEDPVVAESLEKPFLEIVRTCLRVHPEQRCSVVQMKALLSQRMFATEVCTTRSSAEPVAGATEPVVADAKPVETVVEPSSAVTEPTATAKAVATVVEPAAADAERVAAHQEVSAVPTETSAAETEPGTMVTEADAAIAESVSADTEPVTQATEPVAADAKPVETVVEPSSAVTEATATAKAVATVVEPAAAHVEVPASEAAPIAAASEPVSTAASPSAANAEPAPATTEHGSDDAVPIEAAKASEVREQKARAEGPVASEGGPARVEITSEPRASRWETEPDEETVHDAIGVAPKSRLFAGDEDEDKGEGERTRVGPIVFIIVLLLAVAAGYVTRGAWMGRVMPIVTAIAQAVRKPSAQTKAPATPAGSQAEGQSAAGESPAAPPAEAPATMPSADQSPAGTGQAGQQSPAHEAEPQAQSSPIQASKSPSGLEATQTERKTEEEAPGRENKDGAVLQQVMPNVSEKATRGMRQPMEVELRISVNEEGAVSYVEYGSHGPGNYFARIAKQSVLRWKFQPPVKDGQARSSVWVVRFHFGREETDVSAVEVR